MHPSYREMQAGQQRHYENMLLECGELRQRAFDDGKKLEELTEENEKCRENRNIAIIARSKQNREIAVLRIGMLALILTANDGVHDTEDCRGLYRSSRLSPYRQCKKSFPNLTTD